jgi:hypothetical protein
MKTTTLIKGELQIDHERGVIYFRSSEEAIRAGYCSKPLRICGLGNIKAPLQDRQIDLTVRPLGIKDHQINEVLIIK